MHMHMPQHTENIIIIIDMISHEHIKWWKQKRMEAHLTNHPSRQVVLAK